MTSGTQGLAGPQGIQGPTGPAGSIGTLAGSFNSLEDLMQHEANHIPGNFYLIGSDLWFWDQESGRWANAGHVEGPTGPQGAAGPTGPAGSIGKLAGSFNSIEELIANEKNHVPGNFYLVGSELYFWDDANGQWANAGSIQGPQGPQGQAGATPYVGTNGNWFVNGHDTGASAAGIQGPTGPAGPAGSIGTLAGSFDTVADLIANEKNHTAGNFYLVGSDLYFWNPETGQWTNAGPIEGPAGPTGPTGAAPTVGSNGNWFIDGKDTGKPATATIAIGLNGNWFVNGQDTGKSATANITIGSDGYWYVNGQNTGQSAQGLQGPTGPAGSISTIGSDGYWYVNGQNTGQSAQGLQGPTGPVGSAPTISENNTWIIDGEDTGKPSVGTAISDGIAGTSIGLTQQGGQTIQNGAPFPFDYVQTNFFPEAVLDPYIPNGIIWLNQTGLIFLSWWINVQFSLGAHISITVTLDFTQSSNPENGVVSHPVMQVNQTQGHFSGLQLLNVLSIPCALTINNSSGNQIQMMNTPTQAVAVLIG